MYVTKGYLPLTNALYEVCRRVGLLLAQRVLIATGNSTEVSFGFTFTSLKKNRAGVESTERSLAILWCKSEKKSSS